MIAGFNSESRLGSHWQLSRALVHVIRLRSFHLLPLNSIDFLLDFMYFEWVQQGSFTFKHSFLVLKYSS